MTNLTIPDLKGAVKRLEDFREQSIIYLNHISSETTIMFLPDRIENDFRKLREIVRGYHNYIDDKINQYNQMIKIHEERRKGAKL